ncbi:MULTISPECIES: hypothetical protein [Microbacterium]|uniref:hypothetical protein n=1 Tax=Microbacterium TaxID=33882 RepID=UPI001CB6EE8C|nr:MULTISPECIES: hypothetical protein [Microbacterium]
MEQWTAPTKVHGPDTVGNFKPVPSAYEDGLPQINDITKGSAAGSFTSMWRDSGVASSERAVQSQIAVGVPNGQRPTYTLAWDITGVPIL